MEELLYELLKQVKQLNESIDELKKSNLDNKEIFTVDEFCTYTGYKKSYVYKLVNQRKISYTKSRSGRALFFKRVDVISFINAVSIPDNETTKNIIVEQIKKYKNGKI